MIVTEKKIHERNVDFYFAKIEKKNSDLSYLLKNFLKNLKLIHNVLVIDTDLLQQTFMVI